MPLFRSNSPPPPPPVEAHKSGGFFSRRSDSPEQTHAVRSSDSTRSGGGFFGRRRSSSSSDSSRTSANLKHDPSIVAARQLVTDAETAESAADRALNNARVAVQAARQHVKALEKEAMDEARRAKMKQAEAKKFKKSTGRLGRHGS